MLSKKIIKTSTIDNALLLGTIIFTISGAVMFILAWNTISNPLEIIISITILISGNRSFFLLGAASVMSIFPKMARTASGLNGPHVTQCRLYIISSCRSYLK
ncbi:hypothetical protein [Wolbachia endosymbiont of Brugia pahangi]|uniref:hypothetical protein n=1 Tax=Wolbachia endosymbiont of Brugia pahangi TaxID=96495 RepID=UPI00143BBA57|nr:hypothetical protein [Wolbachia endosymbiont of Brugia pahangi]